MKKEKKSLIIVAIIIILLIAIDQITKFIALQTEYMEPIKDFLNIHIAENTSRYLWNWLWLYPILYSYKPYSSGSIN